MKQVFWKNDWFIGLIITLLFIVSMNTHFIQSIERDAYDYGVKSSSQTPNDQIAIIAIDDASIEQIGRWPWPRNIHAKMYDTLQQSNARAIGQTVLFSEHQLDPGLEFIRTLKSSFDKSSLPTISAQMKGLNDTIDEATQLVQKKRDTSGRAAIGKITEYINSSSLQHYLTHDIATFSTYINSAEVALDTDKTLADSSRNTGNVVMAMPFIPGNPNRRPDALPVYVSDNKIPTSNIINSTTVNPKGHHPVSMVESFPPIPLLGETASDIGSLVSVLDVDGGSRSEPLVIKYSNDYYPSMALILAAKSLNLGTEDIYISLGSHVQLGSLNIKTDYESKMHSFFYNRKNHANAFPVDSFYDVLEGKVDVSKYRNKIVLIGVTAFAIGNTMVTPIDPAMSPVLTLAHSISSILNEDFFVQPGWSFLAQLAAIAVVALYLMILLPRIGAAAGFIITLVLCITLFSTHYFLMTSEGIWIQLMTPILLLITGHIILTTKRYLLTERGKAQLDIESAESNRMLGLSMQGHGQLDTAFEKFRKLPADTSAFELLYNLALDYERKRQFNKAQSVYNYIADHDAKFRDIKTRSSRAKAMNETVMLGTNSSSPGNHLNLGDDSIEKPMLGRYTIEKELGKGAMGAIYLGKDPKISRIVAIKTLALSREFEEEKLDKVKQRFFREAETAGRLNHPNIVTIFDAGEEHDLAYIAMEYLKGTNLSGYIKPEKLLPVETALKLLQGVAEGLAYAHSLNVVHRDIKPANIMWDQENNDLKITDFGIARITDSSKTKTGMILGTPSYMSPEQLTGKHVDGQSDIFSLGVMLYQMTTGKLPFKGESMATLMYKIANEAHTPAESINPDLPKCVSIVINRALSKSLDKRYKSAKKMADDIKKCRIIIRKENKGMKHQ